MKILSYNINDSQPWKIERLLNMGFGILYPYSRHTAAILYPYSKQPIEYGTKQGRSRLKGAYKQAKGRLMAGITQVVSKLYPSPNCMHILAYYLGRARVGLEYVESKAWFKPGMR